MYICLTKKHQNYVRQKLIEVQGEIYESAIILGDFNIPQSNPQIQQAEKDIVN